MLDKWKTLTGVSAREIADRLEVPFTDPAAYKKITGGTGKAAGLTDIDTAFMLNRVNEVFGPYGLGWTLDWDVNDVIIQGEPKRPMVAVKRAMFTYILVDEGGNERPCVASCTGGSQNELPFALKGMETSAIGNALSKLRFQEKVYMGKLAHVNAKSYLAKSGNGKKPAAGGTKRGKLPSAKASAESKADISPGDFVVSFGEKYRGKKLSELDPEVLDWYASEMAVINEASKELQRMAQAYKELAPAAD